LHPTIPASSIATTGASNLRILIDHVQRQHHRAMTATTKDKTVTDKISCLLRCELHFGGATRSDFDRNIEVAKAKSMCDIYAREHEHHGLAPFQCDLPRRKREAFRSDLDSLGGSLSLDRWDR
jgi:hypothetical protein